MQPFQLDWERLYFIGRYVLRMSEAEFWRSTLRQIDVLVMQRERVMKEEPQERGTAKDLLAWAAGRRG